MASTELLSALEELQKHYKKCESVSKSLQTHLKNTGEALAKLQKALPEFTALTSNGDPQPQYETAEQYLAQLAFKEQVSELLRLGLQQGVKRYGGLLKTLKLAAKTLAESAPNTDVLRKAIESLQDSTEPRIAAILPDLENTLAEIETANNERFGRTLYEALQTEGIALEGHAPNFFIGRFGIQIAKGKVTLRYGKEDLVSKPPKVAAVIKAYKDHYKQIVARKEDGPEWIKDLYEAWESISNGKEVNIVDVYFQFVMRRQSKAFRAEPIKGNLKNYTRVEFAYDFDRFVNKERLTYKGQRAAIRISVHANTGKPEKSLFIVKGDNPNDGDHYTLFNFVDA